MDPLAVLDAARLAPGQLANAKLIVRKFITAGYPVGLALAAVVNAKAESNLNARAIAGESKGGYSVGLFQLYDYGAGRELAVSPGKPPPAHDPRLDPSRNTARIIAEVRQYGGGLTAAYQSGASVAKLAGIFARDIERPANAAARAVEREQMARQLLGRVADMPAKSLTAGTAGGLLLLPALVPWYYWLVPAGALSILLTVAIARRRL